MLISFRPITDPYVNIAAEEYLVKHTTEDMCVIWINEKSVIIGKHQNAFGEINYPFVKENNIPVIRRISGGGAVYHDLGNVNFTFIQKTDKSNQVDFGRFTTIIKGFIESVGLKVNVNKRNSLFIGDQKFSGHAEHLFHDKVLHHGTILFDTDLDVLKQSISPIKEFKSKALASVRSDVLNLAPLLPDIANITDFVNKLIVYLNEYYPGSQTYTPDASDLDAIYRLAEGKYRTWEWNFGYSPAYAFHVSFPLSAGIREAEIKVENGRIVAARFTEENFSHPFTGLLSNMSGLPHREEEICRFAEENKAVLEPEGLNAVEYSSAFFR